MVNKLNIDEVNKLRTKTIKNKQWDKALFINNALSEYYTFTAFENDKAIKLSEDFLPFIKYCNNSKQIASFYINYAESATYKQEFGTSLTILNTCIKSLKSTKDTTIQEYGYAYLKAGENSSKINNISESASYFKKASEIFTQQKDTLYFLWTQNGLSTLFSSNGLYEEAEKARNPIFNLAKGSKYSQVLAMAHLRASIDAFLQDDKNAEIYNINQALHFCESGLESDISQIVTILTYAYAVGTFARQNEIQKSDSLLSELQKNIHFIDKTPFLKTYFSFGKAYNNLIHNKANASEKILLELIPELKQANEVSNLMQAHYILAKSYENQHKNNDALNEYKAYLHIKDSLNKSASKKKFAYVQTQFEVEKKDLEIEKQQKNILLLSAQNKIKNQSILFGSIFLISIFSIIYLWRSRKYTKNKMKLQKSFAQDLINNIEDERKRISSELHDSIGQNLLLIKNTILLNPEKKQDNKLIDQTIEEVRHISQRLHPFQFEKLGLIASIKNTVENFQNNSDIFYSEDIEVKHLNLSKNKEIIIYRMIQECLNNVEKHSKAIACNVTIMNNNNHFIFQVKDNGVGFNVREHISSLSSLGMKTLKERGKIIGAELNIHSVKNVGTTVQIKVPKY